MTAIGFLELKNIAQGFEAADLILKTADVELLYARPECPGKYCIYFSGEVAAVRSSLEAGMKLAGNACVDQCIIPNIHPQVAAAASKKLLPKADPAAVGVMEYSTITATIFGSDAAVKAADVDLLQIRLGEMIGGKSFAVLTGEVAAVRAAVAAGTGADSVRSFVISSVVIPSPHPELWERL